MAFKYLDVAADLFDVGLDDIHADSTAGDAGHLLRSAEARREDEFAGGALAQLERLFFGDQATFNSLALDAAGVDACAIIGDLNVDDAAFVIRTQEQSALTTFVLRLTKFRHLTP